MTQQMSRFEQEVIDRLARIETKLDNDFRTLHGNGQPGLLAKHNDLERRVTTLEHAFRTQSGVARKIIITLAWLVTTAIACYNLIAKAAK